MNGKNLDNDDTNEVCIGDIEEKNDHCSCCFVNSYSSSCVLPEDKNSETTSLDKKVDLYFNIKKERKNNYQGHFIVIIGYDDTKKLIFYRNPATSKKLSFTSYFNFEISRKSFGTDQDILFIYI